MSATTKARRRKPAEQAMKARELDRSALFDQLPNPVLVVGPDHAIREANASAELFFATSRAIMMRQKLEDLVPFGSPLLALIEHVHRAGISVNEHSIDLGNPRIGHHKLVDVYAAPVDSGQDLVLVTLQERSMARMIERQMNHRAAARSVSGLAAVLAHEVKNPLSGIRGAAQLLEPELPDGSQALTRLICDETDRICSIVDRMEIFGDERPIERSPVNIHVVLDRVIALAEAGFGKHVRFVKEFDPSLPDVPGDQDKLIQALLNLVKNAVEAIGDERMDGQVILRTAFRPGVRLSLPGMQSRVSLPLMIEVQDNGSGIPDDLRGHLFDPFVSTKANGSGLGLALVAKMIGDHGGVVEIDKPTAGTVFRVLLPMAEQSNSTEA